MSSYASLLAFHGIILIGVIGCFVQVEIVLLEGI